jgi:hypothetical protein
MVIQKFRIQNGWEGRGITAVKVATLLCLTYSHSIVFIALVLSNVLVCCASLKWVSHFQIPPSVKCVLLFDFSMPNEKLQLKYVVRLLVFMVMLGTGRKWQSSVMNIVLFLLGNSHASEF